MTNPIRSPRPGPLWRTVRRVAAWLRWRALWRRGMRWYTSPYLSAKQIEQLANATAILAYVRAARRHGVPDDFIKAFVYGNPGERVAGPDWPYGTSELVDAARAAGPTPTAEDIDAWKQAAADSRQRTEDITRALFGDEHDAE